MDDVLHGNIEGLVIVNSGAIQSCTGHDQHDQCCKFSRMIQMYISYPVLMFKNKNVHYII